ncbi:hypothetical protein SDC9_156148 [bioreactor metagenome]|uniref:Uncharacterized protein n=1 Tax=bioreactor metagenome TaxID=1076179 RepID=A0A645F5R7_9ZZZZ
MPFDAFECLFQPVRHRPHKVAVEGGAHSQRHDLGGVFLFDEGDRAGNRSRVSGDDDLRRGIDIRRLADLALRRLGADRADV